MVGTIATVGVVGIRIVLGRPMAGLGVCVAVCGAEAGNRVPGTILPLPLDVPTGLRRSGRCHSMSVAFLDKRLGPEGGILGVVPVTMESHAGVVTIRGVSAVVGTSLMGSRRGWSLGIALSVIAWRLILPPLRNGITGIAASSCVPRARRMAGCVLLLLLQHLRLGRLALSSMMLVRLLPAPTASFSAGSATGGI